MRWGAPIAALILGYLLGASPWGLLAASLLWLVTLALKALARIGALLSAPVALAISTPTVVEPLHLLGLALMSLLGFVPLLPVLGRRASQRGAVFTALAAAGLGFGLMLTPPGALMLQSDLALSGLVAALAAGLLGATSISR